MRTLALEILDRPRYRQLRRDSDQHVHMVAVDRPRVDQHLLALRDLSQQLSATVAHISTKRLIPIFRRPYRYFVVHTRWYLPSHTACEPRL